MPISGFIPAVTTQPETAGRCSKIVSCSKSVKGPNAPKVSTVRLLLDSTVGSGLPMHSMEGITDKARVGLKPQTRRVEDT